MGIGLGRRRRGKMINERGRESRANCSIFTQFHPRIVRIVQDERTDLADTTIATFKTSIRLGGSTHLVRRFQ